MNQMIAEIGSKVTFKLKGETRTYDIVYEGEGNLSESKISRNAPLAQLILGRKKGEVVRGRVPAGEVTIKIIKVEKIEG